jgi:flavin-binding protein dodecin
MPRRKIGLGPYPGSGGTKEEWIMAGETFKLIELVGTSEQGVTEAIDSAVRRASESLQAVDWFEVTQIRGRVEHGKVAEYQVELKIGFRILSDTELATE